MAIKHLRSRLPEGRVRRLYSLEPATVDKLSRVPNASAYIDSLVQMQEMRFSEALDFVRESKLKDSDMLNLIERLERILDMPANPTLIWLTARESAPKIADALEPTLESAPNVKGPTLLALAISTIAEEHWLRRSREDLQRPKGPKRSE